MMIFVDELLASRGSLPVLLQMLAEASIHLTGILLIGPHLTAANQSELLARVQYRTKREIERIVGELAPAPVMPPRIEVLHGERPVVAELESSAAPARSRCTWAAYVRALAGPVRQRAVGVAAGEAPPRAQPESCVNVTARPAGEGSEAGPEKVASETVASGGAHYRMQFTIDQAYLDLLEEARELSQHVIVDRDIVEVQRRALQALVKSLKARKAALAERPRPAPARQRDAGRCAYVDSREQRCRERGGMEVHHRHPDARGGPAEVDNLELRCRAHDTLAAERDFGRERIRELQKQRQGLGSSQRSPAPG